MGIAAHCHTPAATSGNDSQGPTAPSSRERVEPGISPACLPANTQHHPTTLQDHTAPQINPLSTSSKAQKDVGRLWQLSQKGVDTHYYYNTAKKKKKSFLKKNLITNHLVSYLVFNPNLNPKSQTLFYGLYFRKKLFVG